MPVAERTMSELSGLDALEAEPRVTPAATRWWSVLWPKLAGIALGMLIWHLIASSGWRPRHVLPGPGQVLPRLWHELGKPITWRAIQTTMRRAAVGFAVATAVGGAVGLAVARFQVVRAAVGSLITGLQTMPSIAWFPLALLLFRISEAAILFVVVLGAAPSIANGLIAGIDQTPPLLLRAGRVLGARGLSTYRHVLVPAALPAFVAGLKQGWAFVWRSLMAGELIVIIANKPSIGTRLAFEREFADAPGLICWMLIILAIGVLVDAVCFASAERLLLRRRGLG